MSAPLAQRSPRSSARYPARFAAAADPEATAGQLFPAVPGSTEGFGEGADRGDPGGVDRRVSTRRVDELVQAMGLSGISKSQVSKLCKEIDERVHAFLDRPLVGDWPYLWLDATYLKQREGGRFVSVAAIIAAAANTEGKREIVGLHIGRSEAETFWSGFLKSLARRGLRGVKLVISDAHEGLKAAIRRVFGATWQRCRVHWMRTALSYVAKTQQSMVAAALRQAFIQPDRAQASQTLRSCGRPVTAEMAEARGVHRRQRDGRLVAPGLHRA